MITLEMKKRKDPDGSPHSRRISPLALFRRKLAEVWIDSATGDLIQNIDHRVRIAVGDAAVILAEAPSVGFGTPDAAVSLEFIDTDGFRKFFRKTEANGFENGLGDARCNTVISGSPK